MIKKNELRIGNWIKSGENHYRVTADDLSHPYLDRDNPIPLTPEILVGCGAIKKFRIYETSYFIGKLKFTYEYNELSQFARFHYSGKVAYLQYVHQLQNLIHILTNEELIITL